MRKRHIIRKAVKHAIIAKAAGRLARRAEKHLAKH
jgi:hypothetical protein